MAKPSIDLVIALRNTATKLQNSSSYQWGHMGLCNCGFLAQEISKLRKEQIHARAMERHGDWSEQLNDYCPSSGLAMDDLISEMLACGFDTDDLIHLERLSSPIILRTLPMEARNLRYNLKSDVVRYFNTWATLLEASLIESITLPKDLEEIKEGETAHNL